MKKCKQVSHHELLPAFQEAAGLWTPPGRLNTEAQSALDWGPRPEQSSPSNRRERRCTGVNGRRLWAPPVGSPAWEKGVPPKGGGGRNKGGAKNECNIKTFISVHPHFLSKGAGPHPCVKRTNTKLYFHGLANGLVQENKSVTFWRVTIY